MADTITKKDLGQYQKAIVDAVGFSLQQMEQRMDKKYAMESSLTAMEQRMGEKYAREETLRKLMITLDNFLKQLGDYKEEFAILSGEVNKIKLFLKEKFGVEITMQV